jgi:hypothetical protein
MQKKSPKCDKCHKVFLPDAFAATPWRRRSPRAGGPVIAFSYGRIGVTFSVRCRMPARNFPPPPVSKQRRPAVLHHIKGALRRLIRIKASGNSRSIAHTPAAIAGHPAITSALQ